MIPSLILSLASFFVPGSGTILASAPPRPDDSGQTTAAAHIRAPSFNPETGKWPAPSTLYPVTRVVDGDTIWIERDGKRAKLRLLSVDTEEQLIGSPNATALKPETVFGEACARWAEDFFAQQAQEGQLPRVGLAFPPGAEREDIFGRLLCQVVLPDGTDYNLLLVQLGKSPYFNKYGNSRLMHSAFVKAQREAQAARRGIWDPATNRATEPGAPTAKRPYGRLLPWWQARAEAIDRFRSRAAEDPALWIEAEDSEAVRSAFAAGTPIELFGGINRIFEEEDGSLTVLFRAGDKRAAVRAIISAEHTAELLDALDLYSLNDPFRQNYIYLRGRLSQGPRGFRIDGADPNAWRVADPQYDERDQ